MLLPACKDRKSLLVRAQHTTLGDEDWLFECPYQSKPRERTENISDRTRHLTRYQFWIIEMFDMIRIYSLGKVIFKIAQDTKLPTQCEIPLLILVWTCWNMTFWNSWSRIFLQNFLTFYMKRNDKNKVYNFLQNQFPNWNFTNKSFNCLL